MKKLLLIIFTTFCLFTFLNAQEFADFQITTTNQGTGTFLHSALSNFTWEAEGTINGAVQILNDEVFDDGNKFEDIFGQANNAENLRIQLYPNGPGTDGTTILSKDRLTINFDKITPANGWGFCVVDIDVENCLISAIDEFDNEVGVEKINDWLIELFDSDTIEDGLNIPKWDSAHAAILGFNTSEDYVVYNNLVAIGGLNDSEAPAAFFMPDIPLKTLIIDHENLQSQAFVSFHFYIASLPSNDATLGNMKINNEELIGFSSSNLNYEVELPTGTTSVPIISATASDTSATVVITQASELPGTTTIVITAEDGVTQTTYTIEFTIAPNNDATLSSIQINSEELPGFNSNSLEYGIEYSTQTSSFPTISATSTNANATIEITQTPQLPGTATIVVTAEDGVTQKTYTIDFTIPTSTIEFDIKNEILLFPNPTKDKFKIQCSKFKVVDATIELYDLTGKKLLVKQITAGTENIEIDVCHLKNGVYFCKLITKNGSETKKLVIQK
jgi:hypothetical protein